MLLKVNDLLEVNLICFAALTRRSMDCFSVVAGLRLPIARNFLVLTAYGKHRECVIGLDLVISVSITRVRTPYIVIFEDF